MSETHLPAWLSFRFQLRISVAMDSACCFGMESSERALMIECRPNNRLTRTRAIALDLIVMGKSEKPDLDYRFSDHVPYVGGFIEKLVLKNVTLVIHDWGSALGFHYARRHADNIRRIAFMEAVIRPMRWSQFPSDFKVGFKLMRTPIVGWLMISGMNMFVNKILPSAVVRDLTDIEMQFYRAPYPTVQKYNP